MSDVPEVFTRPPPRPWELVQPHVGRPSLPVVGALAVVALSCVLVALVAAGMSRSPGTFVSAMAFMVAGIGLPIGIPLVFIIARARRQAREVACRGTLIGGTVARLDIGGFFTPARRRCRVWYARVGGAAMTLDFNLPLRALVRLPQPGSELAVLEQPELPRCVLVWLPGFGMVRAGAARPRDANDTVGRQVVLAERSLGAAALRSFVIGCAATVILMPAFGLGVFVGILTLLTSTPAAWIALAKDRNKMPAAIAVVLTTGATAALVWAVTHH